MMNVCEGAILCRKDLPAMLKQYSAPVTTSDIDWGTIPFVKKKYRNFGKRMIADALNRSKGNIKQASKLLEIPRPTLQYKMKKFFDS